MPQTEDLVVTIEPDTTRFDEELARVLRHLVAAAPLIRLALLAQQRHRSRLVTRRKQRRAW